jgi:cytochrome c peroxidase
MKHVLNAVLVAVVVLTLAQCVKPGLNEANQQLATPDLTQADYMDAAFLDARLNVEFLPTNLFTGTGTSGSGFGFGGGFGGSAVQNELFLLDNATIALGRVLFYDPRLSINNNIACGSCHNQDKSFTDGKAKSQGTVGVETDRNAMGLCNLAFDGGHFWRNEEVPLEEMLLGPVSQHIEMGTSDMEALAVELAATDYYPALFQQAFGSSTINATKIQRAMGHFLGRMVSFDAPIDRDQLDPTQRHGQAIFNTNCGGCHRVEFTSLTVSAEYYNPAPAMPRVSNIGLDVNDALAARAGGFKIPLLRNVAVSAPYMHDGRFTTLEQVIDHYNTGIQLNPNLDPRLINTDGSPLRMNMTAYDKSALKSFLESLTDVSFLNDQRFSDPFKQ